MEAQTGSWQQHKSRCKRFGAKNWLETLVVTGPARFKEDELRDKTDVRFKTMKC